MLKAKQVWRLLVSLLVSFALCLGEQSICFTDFDDRDPYRRGPHTSYQPDLFLTNRYSQDFHSLFGHHIKTFTKLKHYLLVS